VVATRTRARAESAVEPASVAWQTADHTAQIQSGGSPWLQLAGLFATAGCLAAGISAVAGHSQWQTPSLGVGASFALIALSAALRSRSRRRRVARVAERVAPMIGLAEATSYQLGRLLRVRWPVGAGRNDPPSRITICPPASYPLTDAGRLERIADVTGRTLRIQLRVAAVRRRRHEVVLVPARLEDAEAAEPAPRELRCAEVVVDQRLGTDAAIVTTAYDPADDDSVRLESLEVRFIADEDNTDPEFWTAFEAAFNRQVPGRWQAVPDLIADPVTRQATCHIRRKPTLPTRIPYDLDRLEQCGEYDIPYAVDEYGGLVTWSLDISPHMLVSGATRSGKSSTMRNVVRGVVARGWPALVCDPRRTGLLGMRGWPGVQALATPADTRQMIAIIDYVHAEMDRRYAAVEAGVTRKSSLQPLLLVLDEFRELHEEITLWWAREGARAAGRRRAAGPPVLDQIGAIARLGGEAGVHLVMGIKRPDVDAKILPPQLRNNCRCRCSHGALSRDEAQQIWGNDATGRSVPPMIQGRGTAVRADGTPGEVQSLWFPDPLELHGDDIDLYQRLRPAASPHPWLVAQGESLVATTNFPVTPWTDPAVPPPDALAAVLDQDARGLEWERRYGQAETVPAGSVREADLIEVEAGSNVWIVVDDVAADPDEPDLLYIDGRTVDSGLPNTVVADEDAMIARRRQL
jgi:S-DNA-T family DNA segregation ATPase FtsK/SpoIIIE